MITEFFFSIYFHFLIFRHAIVSSQYSQSEKTQKREPPPPAKKRFLGSMIADLEEKTNHDMKRRQKMERRQNRERLLLQTKRVGKPEMVRHHTQQQRRRRSDHRVSSDEEALSAEQVQKLTEESRRMKVQELTRTINTAQEGDLRTLLQQRKSGGVAGAKEQSNSDDEDVLERKLREKVKEEKHLRLFGKLTRSERARMNRETENLRKRLQKARLKRRERDGEYSFL